MSGKEKIRIRKFERQDLEEVKALIEKTIDTCYDGYYCREVMDYFDMFHWPGNILKIAHEGFVAVALIEGKIVATGSIIKDKILRVFVDPSYQKRGLGKMIMDELEKQAAANGLKSVELRSLANAKKFYESIGYQTIAKGRVEVDNGSTLEYYQMVKSLEADSFKDSKEE